MHRRPVVLVTGAARRIGRAIALDLAGNGWDVAVHHRGSAVDASQTAAQARAAGARALVFAADLADELECAALLPAVSQAFGRIDAVVNNASLFEYDDVASFGHAAMERAWRTNTAPAVLLARALHASLLRADRSGDESGDHSGEQASEQHGRRLPASGCVVNLLDQKLWNPNPDYLSYTLSKAALEAATTLLAQALAPALRVCGVAPGVTLLSGAMSGAEFAASHAMTPLQRSSTPEDIARCVRFLLESPAITGTTVVVDGGQHLQPQPRDVMFLARERHA